MQAVVLTDRALGLVDGATALLASEGVVAGLAHDDAGADEPILALHANREVEVNKLAPGPTEATRLTQSARLTI